MSAHLDCGQTTAQLNPFLSAIYREEQTEFSSGKKQIRVHMIFGDPPDRASSPADCPLIEVRVRARITHS
jgi:hypothetical protein